MSLGRWVFANDASQIDPERVPLKRGDVRLCNERFGTVPFSDAVSLLFGDDVSTEQWLDARRRSGDQWRIGASELAAVLDLSPHASPFSLWWAKQDGWSRSETTMGQHIGHKLENVIGELWAEQHPEAMLVRPAAALYGHPIYPWMVCTPDFLAVRDVIDECSHGADCTVHPGEEGMHNYDAARAVTIEPVECKSDEGGKGWGKPGTDEVPEHHRVQVYVQCEVFGARRGHLMRLAGKRPAAYVLPYDGAARAKMASWAVRGAQFVQSLADDIAPDLDGHKATTEALQIIHGTYVKDRRVQLDPSLIREFLGVDEMFRTVSNAREEIRNRVRDALRDAQFGTDENNRAVVKRNIYKRSGYEVGPTMVDELRRMS